jgi:all-beta uncharacterized protein/BACON domain-containing protein
MLDPITDHPRVFALLLAVALVSSAACQSSSTNVIGPSGTKCAVTLPAALPTLGADGGSGTLTVTVAPECVWSASSAAEWISITSSANGQGAGTVTFAATGNPTALVRRGALVVGERRVEVMQSGAACQFTLTPQTASVPAAGGDGSVTLNGIEGCQWTATSQADWISIVGPPSGTGSSSIRFTAGANDGPARSGLIAIADRTFAINQSASGSACAIALGKTEQLMPAAGGTDAVTVTAQGDCAWTAVSQAAWITVASGGTGRGTAPVTLTIAPNTGGTRVGLVTIGGQTYVVTQAAGNSSGCSYSLASNDYAAPAAGGATPVGVTAPPGCAWTAASLTPWIVVAAGGVGNGSGAATLAIAANTGAARSGAVMVAGFVFTVTQAAPAPGCTYDLAATDRSMASGGGSFTVDVSAGAGCAWTASSQASWITLGGTSGTGNGTVTLTIAANAGNQRSGTATIAGRTFTVNQSAPPSTPACTYDVNPGEQSVPSLGGAASAVNVTAGNGCTWTATSQASWITVANGASGSGNGTVSLTIALNTGAERSGTVAIAGRTHTVTQASGLLPCSYSLDSTEATSGAAGGTIQVAVTAGLTCTWQAQSNAPWITVTSGASGLANGTVRLAVAANGGAQRSGTVTIAGQTFTVTQAPAPASCTFSLTPTTQSVGPLGGDFTVSITTQAGCTWSATTGDNWIQLLGDTTGTGSGPVSYRIGLGLIFSRSGRITIGGQNLTVNQAALLLSNAR